MLSCFYYYGASELLKGYVFNEPRRHAFGEAVPVG